MADVVTTNDTKAIADELLDAALGEFGLSPNWPETDAVKSARKVIENRLDEIIRGWETRLEEVEGEKDEELAEAKARIEELEAAQ